MPVFFFLEILKSTDAKVVVPRDKDAHYNVVFLGSDIEGCTKVEAISNTSTYSGMKRDSAKVILPKPIVAIPALKRVLFTIVVCCLVRFSGAAAAADVMKEIGDDIREEVRKFDKQFHI